MSHAGARTRILLLSAYDAGSHRRWREQLVASQPAFEWGVLTLAPRHFRWRIRGNALSWLDEPLLSQRWDALLATSMVDLVGLKAFHPHLAHTPTALYMHENQFAYPGSGRQHSSAEPCMINLYSALAAERVLFNSDWNRESFFAGARRFLDRLPDAMPSGVLDRVRRRASVLPVPIEDRLFLSPRCSSQDGPPHLLWNHRWEYDKAPERLLAILRRLKGRGTAFRLSVVGEQFRRQPEVFARIREEFSAHLEQWGYLQERADYDRLLQRADVVLSTALHDFQGLAMLEAMASGCVALAPDRLAYPEYVPASQLYRSDIDRPECEADAAVQTLVRMLQAPDDEKPVPPDSWRLSRLRPQYTQLLHDLVSG